MSLTDPRWLTGEICSTSKGFALGKTAAKTKDGTYIGIVSVTDPRFDANEIVSVNYGQPAPHNKNNAPAIDVRTGKRLGRISSNDPRWKSGEIVSAFKDCVVVKDKAGVVFRTSIYDTRYISQELVPVILGSKRTLEQKQYQSDVHKEMRVARRVCCLVTRKEYTIQNFTKYVLRQVAAPQHQPSVDS